MSGSRHNSRRAKTTTRPQKPVIYEDDEQSSNDEGGGTGQYQVETLPGLGKFIRDYEAQLTSLQISSNSSSALFPLGKRPFIVLGYNGPDILHAPFQRCAIWNKSFSELSPPTKEFLGNGKWESNVRNVLADQLFFYKSYLPPSFGENLYQLEPLAEGDCGFITLQFFQAFLNPPEVAPLTTTGMRRFLHESLTNDHEYFSTSVCMATMQRNQSCGDLQNWLEFGLPISKMDVISQMDKTEKDNLYMIRERDPSNESTVMMSAAHLEVYAKATKTRIVFLTFWLQPRHFTYLDVDWRNDELKLRYEDQISCFPDFGDGFDFYKTAVILLGPTCKEVDISSKGGDKLVWPSKTQPHFSLWVPLDYAEAVKHEKRIPSLGAIPRKKKVQSTPSLPTPEKTKETALPVVEPPSSSVPIPRKKEQTSLPPPTSTEKKKHALPVSKPIPISDSIRRKKKCSTLLPPPPPPKKKKQKNMSCDPVAKSTVSPVSPPLPPDPPFDMPEESITVTVAESTLSPQPGSTVSPVPLTLPTVPPLAMPEDMETALPVDESIALMFDESIVIPVIPVLTPIPTHPLTLKRSHSSSLKGNHDAVGYYSTKFQQRRSEILAEGPLPLSESVHRHYMDGEELATPNPASDEHLEVCHLVSIFVRSGICLICRENLSFESKELAHYLDCTEMAPYLASYTVSRRAMTQKQKKLMMTHVDKVHPNVPFVFQQEAPRKVAALQGSGDFKAVVQDVLWTSFLVNPISLDEFAAISVIRNDHRLKIRLAILLTYSKCEMSSLKSKIRKRHFFVDWMKSNKADAPEKGCQAARERTVNHIISTGSLWLEKLLESLLNFNFMEFLDRHDGNWSSIWNSMVLFFQRGLFFAQAYPPAINIYKLRDNLPDNLILKTLNESLMEYLEKRSDTKTL